MLQIVEALLMLFLGIGCASELDHSVVKQPCHLRAYEFIIMAVVALAFAIRLIQLLVRKQKLTLIVTQLQAQSEIEDHLL